MFNQKIAVCFSLKKIKPFIKYFIECYEQTRILPTNKVVTMAIKKNLNPTESELEILQILWQRESATVREVHEDLSKTKISGYTTTLKLLQIMFEKKLVSRDESAKTHIYKPIISRQKTQKQFLDKMIDGLFYGSSTQLVLQALGNQKASKNELEEIQKYLDDLKKE